MVTKGAIPGQWSEASLTEALERAGYRLATYKRGGSFREWILSRRGEHMGTVKLLTKSGKATYDFMHHEIDLRLRTENPGLQIGTPKGSLVELGALTCLEQRRSLIAWGLRTAPVLAVDEDRRLFIVYAGKIARPSTLAELRAYDKLHWGKRGKGHARHGRIAQGPFLSLGPGVAIVYTTKKGSDDKLTDYVHAWGKVPPEIAVHDCGKPGCAWDGALALIGGTYTVTERGIIG